MKANIKSLFLTACATTFITGCTDLDVAVESQYTELPTTEISVEGQMRCILPNARCLRTPIHGSSIPFQR